MAIRFLIVMAISLFAFSAVAQKQQQVFPFSVRLESFEIDSFPALQSFAFATWKGKWLLVGGRKDGLHRRQPWASFNEAGQNNVLYVADPEKRVVWNYSLKHLPVSMQEQLQSTNMEFYQADNKLILAGGYGYSKTADDHITYPYLTILKVDEIIDAVINQRSPDNAFVQIKDQRMAVTGGRLGKIGDTLVLVCGQRFDGMYNPMGPDHGPGFEQQYSNEIRKFNIAYENNVPVIKNYRAIKDSVNLHRRDYNLVPQIFKQNEFGYSIYSGVFQYTTDLPFTNFVDIHTGTYKVNNKFSQQFSHYHSAVLPMYDKGTSIMYSIFFGGIAQFYPDYKGKIIKNDEVPFTKTISVITRNGNKVEESYLPLKMPGYLGAAAEFIFMPELTLYNDGIADLQQLKNDEIAVGYIVGGINSSEKNIFFSNTGKESKANSSIIKVFIKRESKYIKPEKM